MKSYTIEQTEDKKEDVINEKEFPTDTANPKVFRYQITVTLILVSLWITTGMGMGLDSTCLPDQRDRLGVETSDMSTIFAVSGLIGMASSIVFAVFDDLWKEYTLLLISIGMALLSVLTIVTRYLTNYVAYFVLYCMNRLLFAPIDMIGNAVILRTWGERASGPLYAIHFGFGFGATIGPFVAKPFISQPDENITTTTTELTPTTDPPRFPDGSRIEIAYTILGLIQLAIGAALLVLYIIGPPKEFKNTQQAQAQEKQALKDVCLPNACANGSIPCAVLFLALFFFFYFFNVGRELGLNLYLYTYATESDLGLKQDDAVLLTSVYNAFYMSGRIISVILARCFSIQILHCTGICLVFIIQLALAVWGVDDPLLFVIFSCGCGLFGSPLWPGQMSWSDQYITMTSTSLFLIPLGAGLGNFVSNPIYGKLLNEGNWQDFLNIMVVCSAVMLVQMILAQGAGIKQGTRFPKTAEAEDEEDNVFVISFVKRDDDVCIEHSHSPKNFF